MNKLYKTGILIAFGELFLKSKGVKEIFQRRLVKNLAFFLGPENQIHSFRERIFIETDNVQKASKIVKNIFGIVWFAECFWLERSNLAEFSKFIDKNYKNWIKRNESFAIRLKKESGLVKQTSQKIIEKIAQNIDRKVNLDKPDKELFIEIRKSGWFLYFKKKKGAGGLPVGSSGKVLSLISGGIDSPVSAYLSAKRGAENIWVHFHSFPLVSRKSIEKIEELAEIFLRYQTRLKIYFVPFSDIQKKIKVKALAKYRVLLYRRFMLKIGERITEKENCLALITGESLGQVSSQTLPNLKISQEAVKIPVLRPLIGQDKQEIIKLARKIGTYNISIKPQEDCCTLFVSQGQTGGGDIKLIKELEKKLESDKIIKETIKHAEIRQY